MGKLFLPHIGHFFVTLFGTREPAWKICKLLGRTLSVHETENENEPNWFLGYLVSFSLARALIVPNEILDLKSKKIWLQL